MFLSTRGKNADICQAAKILPTLGYDTMSGISTAQRSPLAHIFADHGATLHEYPVPSGPDGFLATNSLMATLVLLYRAVLTHGRTDLQDASPGISPCSLLGSQAALSHHHLVVLAQGWASPAGLDLETRFAEAALANVTVTDPRNFAHGRYNWFSLHSEHTGIVSLETPENRREAERTLIHLPGSDVLRVCSTQDGPAATIELVRAMMELAGMVAETRGMDPGRPVVPEFGRRLYHAGPNPRVETKKS